MNNKHEIKGSVVEVIIPHKKSGEEFKFTLDAEDLPLIDSKASWGMDKNKTSAVANFRKNKKACKITMHRLLTGAKNINFADGNRFNLRRSNLVESVKRKRRRKTGQNLKGNQYIIRDTYAEMVITGKNPGVVLIDKEDILLASEYTWNINPVQGYVQSRTREGRENSKTVLLHRLIMRAGQNKSQIDHIDRNKLNNRKKNLRFVTWSENQLNKGLYSNSTTGFRGVSMTKSFTFTSQIKIQDKHLRKTFKTFEEAKSQRLAWEKEYGIPPI